MENQWIERPMDAPVSTQKLGTLRIKANATRLTITAVTVEGDGLFLLRNVKLMPLSESSPP